MSLPPELSKPAPRDIDFNHELFSKNRKRITGIFIGSAFIIPLVAFLFWWKFDDVMAGVYWGLGITALIEMMGIAMLINTKKSVALFKNGIATLGTVESAQAPADKHGNAYIVLKVSYTDKIGMRYSGNVAQMGKAAEADRKAGDQIAVLYLDESPTTFAIYSPGIGISMSRSKQQN